MRVLKDPHFVAGVGALVVLLTCVTVAFAVSANWHGTNGVDHGLNNYFINNHYAPYGWTNPPGGQYSTAEVRHYSDDGSFNVQCSSWNYGFTQCGGDWGSLPCHKRYVGGTTGLMSRHWMRASGCSGDLHG